MNNNTVKVGLDGRLEFLITQALSEKTIENRLAEVERLVVNSTNDFIDVLEVAKQLPNLMSIRLTWGFSPINYSHLIASCNIREFHISAASSAGKIDLDDILKLEQLDSLTVTNSIIKNPPPLERITKMKKLELWGVTTRDLAFLGNNRELRDVRLWDSRVEFPDGLSSLAKLIRLDMGRSKIKTLEGIEGARGVEVLLLDHVTQVHDISSIGNLENLKILSVTHMKKIKGIGDVFHKCRSLEEVRCSNTELEDFMPEDLFDCESLKKAMFSKRIRKLIEGQSAKYSSHKLEIKYI